VSLDAELCARLLALDALDQRPSRFGGKDAFFVGKREVAHFEGPGVLDLRLTRREIRSRKEDLEADPRATLRGSSDWLELACAEPADLDWVIALVEVAIAANR